MAFSVNAELALVFLVTTPILGIGPVYNDEERVPGVQPRV